jgi:hypothetical protein
MAMDTRSRAKRIQLILNGKPMARTSPDSFMRTSDLLGFKDSSHVLLRQADARDRGIFDSLE